MSRVNIIRELGTSDGGLVLVFGEKDGGVVAYKFSPAAASAYAGGADPRNLGGAKLNTYGFAEGSLQSLVSEEELKAIFEAAGTLALD